MSSFSGIPSRQGPGRPGGALSDARLTELAARHGTPLTVIDGSRVRAAVARFLAALSASGEGRLFYASKALALVPLIRVLASCGCGIEAVSAGEAATALAAGVPPGDILVNGSPKTPAEIDFYVRSGIMACVIDTWEEIPLWEEALARVGAQASALIRYTPAAAPNTHHFVQTAGEGSKFGFLRHEVPAAACRVSVSPHLRLAGLHVHIGSSLMSIRDHLDAGEDAALLLQDIARESGEVPPVLDLGGGFATPTAEQEPDVRQLVKTMDTHLARLFGEVRPAVWLEPGRALIEGAGTLVYRVLAVKERPAGPLILLDGGMGDNIRPALYGARYPLRLVGGTGGDIRQDVYGRYCESADYLGELVARPAVPRDLVRVDGAGAYTYSMASLYNRVGRPAVVWEEGGVDTLFARREEVADMMRLDMDAAPAGKGPQDVRSDLKCPDHL